jgi:uncharacterized protein with FMN-binding domain
VSRAGIRHPVRRAVLLVAGTVTGLGLVLSYRTPPNGTATLSPSSEAGGTSLSGSRTGSSAGGTNKATPASRNVTGQSVSTQYGPVQVSVTTNGNRITDVSAVALPNGDSRSAQISSYAEPQLRQQALAAQSAGISGVAGASYTSQGYEQSLQSALTQLGMA